MINKEAYHQLCELCDEYDAQLVAVSKTKPIEAIMELYEMGHRDFGENRVQELQDKHPALPDDIRWHAIGHLQKNKVKYIAPYVHMIHAVDSQSLLAKINAEAEKNGRKINVLLQVKIAQEDSKYGLSEEEATLVLDKVNDDQYPHIEVCGLMGMATFSSDMDLVRGEFRSLRDMRERLSQMHGMELRELSMGMSGDYQIALEECSSMIRVGSLLFGNR